MKHTHLVKSKKMLNHSTLIYIIQYLPIYIQMPYLILVYINHIVLTFLHVHVFVYNFEIERFCISKIPYCNITFIFYRIKAKFQMICMIRQHISQIGSVEWVDFRTFANSSFARRFAIFIQKVSLGGKSKNWNKKCTCL